MTKKNRTASFKKSLQRKKILVFKTMMDLATKKISLHLFLYAFEFLQFSRKCVSFPTSTSSRREQIHKCQSRDFTL